MHTTRDFLSIARARLSTETPCTNYRLGILLAIHESTISNWEKGRSAMDPRYVHKFALATGFREEYIYACIEAERAKSPEIKRLLARIAAQYAPKLASILLAVFLLTFVNESAISQSQNVRLERDSGATVYTLCELAAPANSQKEDTPFPSATVLQAPNGTVNFPLISVQGPQS